jgi:hypothetical protein
MSELPGREDVPQAPRRGREPTSPAVAAALVGHVVALVAAVTDSVILNIVVVAGLGCSVIAIAALAGFAPSELRTRRAVTALIGAHGLAAAIMLAGLAPRAPPTLPLAALAAAAALGGVCLVIVRSASMADRPPRPLAVAPRIAAIALVIQMILQLWAASTGALVSPLRAVGFLALSAVGIVLLASMSTIALRLRRRWAIAGLLAWTVGWVASMADLSALILWSLGGTFPMGRHQLRVLDAELVQIVATLGGLAIGAALVTAIREPRFRHSAMVLLAGYAAFGLIAAVGEHRIDLAADFPSIVALRRDRDLADAITDVTLAGMLWLYWRRVAARDHPAGSRGARWTREDR